MEHHVGFSPFHSTFPSTTTDSFTHRELQQQISDNLLLLDDNSFQLEDLAFEQQDPMLFSDFNFDIEFDPDLHEILSSLHANDESNPIGVEGVNEDFTNEDICLMFPVEAEKEQEEQEEEEEEENEPSDRLETKEQELNCKNLLSERNRRKRLSQQLLELRALVPNITKMDKRSVLQDALNYLIGVHEETTRVVAELEAQTRKRKSPDNDSPCDPFVLRPSFNPMARTQILEIDTEKMEDRRFVVKITSQGGGAGSTVRILRMIEALRFNITYALIESISSQNFLTMVFIKLRKPGKMTEVKINDYITRISLRSGLIIASEHYRKQLQCSNE